MNRKWAAGLIAAAAIAAIVALRPTDVLDTVPKVLQGRWTTDNQRYQDRIFRIDDKVVVFETGDMDDIYGAVKHVLVSEKEDATRYEIGYDTLDDGSLRLALYFKPVQGGLIWFENQQNVLWRRSMKTGD